MNINQVLSHFSLTQPNIVTNVMKHAQSSLEKNTHSPSAAKVWLGYLPWMKYDEIPKCSMLGVVKLIFLLSIKVVLKKKCAKKIKADTKHQIQHSQILLTSVGVLKLICMVTGVEYTALRLFWVGAVGQITSFLGWEQLFYGFAGLQMLHLVRPGGDKPSNRELLPIWRVACGLRECLWLMQSIPTVAEVIACIWPCHTQPLYVLSKFWFLSAVWESDFM